MKKIALLISVTLILVGTIFFTGNSVKASLPVVNVYEVKHVQAKDTIICNGNIEYKKTKDIKSSSSGLIKKINVKKGDFINKGDILFTLEVSNITTPSLAESISEKDVYSAIKNRDFSSLSKYSTETSGVAENTSETVDFTASSSGRILDIKENECSPVVSGQTVMTIVSDDKLCVRLPVNESKISEISVGQQVEITGSGFKNSKYEGKVSFVDDVAQQVSTGMGKETAVDVKVDINNPGTDIKRGYTAKCTITTNINEKCLKIPYEAVIYDNDTTSVYVYNNGTARKKQIKLGTEYIDGAEVVSGLDEGEKLILNPENVSNFEKVKIDCRAVK